MLRIDEHLLQFRLTQKHSKILTLTYLNDNEVVAVSTKMRFAFCALVFALALAPGGLGINIDKSKYDEAMVLGADGQV